jgi:hypothetical protein
MNNNINIAAQMKNVPANFGNVWTEVNIAMYVSLVYANHH